MNDQREAGLRAGDQSVALKGVRIDATLHGPTAEVTVTQRYRNDEATPVEAVYLFPLDEGAAVCGFEARLDGKLVVGRVVEREAAFEAYDDALAMGHGAYLLDQERPDVFTASVGNLPPGGEVELTLRYVMLVEREDDALRFTLPTTVAPRYVPRRTPRVGQPDEDKLNPPHARDVPYGLTLSVAVETPGLRRVASPTHPIETELRPGGADVRLGQDEVALDRDFVLLVAAEPAPHALVAREEDGTRVALLTFAPTAPPPEAMDVVFVVDRSGSMNGRSIEEAKKALLLAIRALSPGDRFDVIGFGSRHEAMFGGPIRYDEGTLERATHEVQRMKANLGGTEILAPLHEALGAPRRGDGTRRVLLLTDGQVGNEDEIIALAREHRRAARIFTLGIGAAASRHLVKGVARASRGAAAFIAPGERIEPKVLSLFAKLRTPSVDDVRIDWKGLDVELAPREVPPVFADGLLRVFARVRGGSASEVVLHAAGAAHTVALDLEPAPRGGPLPTLWARERMRELEDETARRPGSQQRRGKDPAERVDAQLVELGARYGLVSRATSYVAVEERAAEDRTTSPASLRRIPIALPTGWGGSAPAAQMLVGGAPMAAAAPPVGFAAAQGRPESKARGRGPREPLRAMASALRRAAPASPSASHSARPRMEQARSASAAPSAEDPLFDLLMTQAVDGGFAPSDALRALLGADRAARFDVALATCDDPELLATALVVAHLEAHEPTRRSEWLPAARKARAWLAQQPATFDVTAML